jgi:hypothetical protein
LEPPATLLLEAPKQGLPAPLRLPPLCKQWPPCRPPHASRRPKLLLKKQRRQAPRALHLRALCSPARVIPLLPQPHPLSQRQTRPARLRCPAAQLKSRAVRLRSHLQVSLHRRLRASLLRLAVLQLAPQLAALHPLHPVSHHSRAAPLTLQQVKSRPHRHPLLHPHPPPRLFPQHKPPSRRSAHLKLELRPPQWLLHLSSLLPASPAGQPRLTTAPHHLFALVSQNTLVAPHYQQLSQAG